MLIDEKEKERFIAYLELNAASCKGMIEQFEKMPGPIMDELVKREKQKMVAFLIVADELKNGESMTVSK